MELDRGKFDVRLSTSEADLRAAERLRYHVFVKELGGDGPMVDHQGQFERDEFDPAYDHLVLVDSDRDPRDLNHVIGVYRLLSDGAAQRHGRYYSEGEYDLSILKSSKRRLLELGRSCLHPDHRGGIALHLLWEGLARYVLEREIEILFGVASLHGTDIKKLALPLSHLNAAHLAPPELRVRAVSWAYQSMALIPKDQIDRAAAMRQVPALIKSYLRLGGFVGDGAFIDHDFNTTDVCLVMDTARMSKAARVRFENGQLV